MVEETEEEGEGDEEDGLEYTTDTPSGDSISKGGTNLSRTYCTYLCLFSA